MRLAGQEVKTKPEIPSLEVRQLRAKINLEEVLELIVALGFGTICDDYGCVLDIDDLLNQLRNSKSLDFAEDHKPNLVEIADGLADLHYVAYCGTGASCGLNMAPIFAEVHRSNMSKFIDGHRREDGKWIKGPSYSAANLSPIIQEQIEKEEK